MCKKQPHYVCIFMSTDNDYSVRANFDVRDFAMRCIHIKDFFQKHFVFVDQLC